MRSINGINLTSTTYKELRELVQLHDGGMNVTDYANSRLRPTGEKYEFDPTACEIYETLRNHDLIKAVGVAGGFTRVRLTQTGIDFIHDYDAAQITQKAQQQAQEQKRILEKQEDRKMEHRHEWCITIFKLAAGFVSGLIIGNIDRIITAIQALS